MTRLKQLSQSWKIFILLQLLCIVGLFFIYEASAVESFAVHGHQYFFLGRQTQWYVVGMIAFLFGRFFPISVWQKLAKYLFLGALFSLILVFVPGIGMEINGAKRWFLIGTVSFQPVELFKMILILYLSSWLASHQRVAPFLFSIVPVMIILLLQPDFGSLLMVLFIALVLFFVAGGSIKQFLLPGIIGSLILVLAVVVTPYRLQRVRTFFNPESDPLGSSFQIRQITLALGSGGWWGKGLGNSQQKFAFIPEASSDSIFAIIGEEVGFIGSIFLLGLILLYLSLLFTVGMNQQPGSFEQLLVIGFWAWSAGQVLLNLAAVVALVPLTGLPFPYFSYGGSSLVSLLLMNGVVLKIAHDSGLTSSTKSNNHYLHIR